LRQVTRVLESVGVNQQKLEGLASSLSPGKLEELAARLTRVADRLNPRCQRDALRQSCPTATGEFAGFLVTMIAELVRR
jgi:hypothetical protein